MRILFISEFFPRDARGEVHGGIEARCYLVAKELAKRHEVTVIASREEGTDRISNFSNINVIRCGMERRYSQKGSLLARLSFGVAAYRQACSIDADIIEGQNYIAYLPAYFAGKRKKALTGGMYADVLLGSWTRALGPLWGTFWEMLERLILTLRWDYLVTISNSTESKLRKHGIPEEKIRTVYCGLDLAEFKGRKEKYNIPTVIFIARLVNYKKADTLIRAVALLNKKVRCIIIGTGPEEKRLKDLAAGLGIRKIIEFKGHIKGHDKVVDILKRSHVFCLPSEIEGFGIVSVEAMAAGVPYVSSDIQVTREITREGRGGFLFRLDDPEDLASKIQHLLEDKAAYKEKKKEALALAKEYSIEKIAHDLEEHYAYMIR